MSAELGLHRNSAYNLAGNVLPLLVGVVTIPKLVSVLGTDRFGVLTLTWVVMGYFSLFDLGLGRALTQIVAERTDTGRTDELPVLIRSGLVLMLGLGLLGGACLAIVSPWIIGRVLKLPAELRHEALASFYLMSLSVPAVTWLAGLRGVLEARHKFLQINILRICMGVLTFLGPWLVSFKTNHLFWIVLSLEIMRYTALLAYYRLCKALVPEMRTPAKNDPSRWKGLLSFGGWMTISNIISPLMVNVDRFFIGALISTTAIAYYATPFDMVAKVLSISGAVVAVLFPLFGNLHKVDMSKAKEAYFKGLRLVSISVAPVLLVIGLGAHTWLSLWLGPAFADHSSEALQVLCFGMFANALAAVPFAFIQGLARPDVTAKFHLVELPIYFLLLWHLGHKIGVNGVALAWTIRAALDFVLLMVSARYFQREQPNSYHSGRFSNKLTEAAQENEKTESTSL